MPRSRNQYVTEMRDRFLDPSKAVHEQKAALISEDQEEPTKKGESTKKEDQVSTSQCFGSTHAVQSYHLFHYHHVLDGQDSSDSCPASKRDTLRIKDSIEEKDVLIRAKIDPDVRGSNEKKL